MRRTIILCTLALACAPDGHEGTTGETGTTGGTTDDRPAGCACIPETAEPGVFGPPELPTCGEHVCGAIVGQEALSGGLELDAPANLDCALLKLRDRVPGLLTWEINPNQAFTDEGYVLIHADGNAIFRRHGARDLGYVVGDAQLGPLKSVGFFSDCLALPVGDAGRLDCLRTAMEAVTAVCDPGWSGGF